MLNGGSEVELFRFAEHGESIWLKSRYLDIYEKETSKGVMLFVEFETDFLDRERKLVMRFRKTQIRRQTGATLDRGQTLYSAYRNDGKPEIIQFHHPE